MVSEPTIDEQLAARRALRDDATARMTERPCPDACGHDHLSPQQIAAWGLWNVLRVTGRMGKEHVAAALEALAPRLPDPEVYARPPRAGEVPKSAWETFRLGEEHGWYGSLTYSRGPHVHSRTGKYLRMVDVITLRLARQLPGATLSDMQRLVAAWFDGKFETATAWGAGSPAVALGSPDMKAHIERTTRP
jgi:hypothetical protein